jgi:hypothetical protein
VRECALSARRIPTLLVCAETHRKSNQDLIFIGKDLPS